MKKTFILFLLNLLFLPLVFCKEAEVKMVALKKSLKEFAPGKVLVTDNFYNSVTQKDVDFLNTFNPDRLLFNFRKTAGIENTKAKAPYSGWENTRIGGHTLGHYLAAAGQAVARGYGNCKGKDGLTLEERLNYLLDGLAECQKKYGTGFIFGATMADPSKPELQFDKLENGDPSDTWVPWYTVHKLMNGLVEAYKMTENPTALEVAQNFGEWIYGRTSKWTLQVQQKVLGVEYGGMNDCLYELYKCAKKSGYKNSEHFLKAAHSFDEEWLFKNVNSITNRHANTTIPKFVGAINRYLTLLEDGKTETEYLKYAEDFWELVVNHHSYITGGNSECEHFGNPDILDAERSNTNCETCNTHNMLKLSRGLYQATGLKKYADFYENTFLNAIMASVNPESGMTTYFQPMATGCFKNYCNPDVNKNYFWCCTGTGLENFTKIGDSFYFYDNDTLFVNCYVSSKAEWEQKGIILEQKTNLPMTDKVELSVKVNDNSKKARKKAKIALRIPDWICSPCECSLNGKPVKITEEMTKNGYILISHDWVNGDIIQLRLPMAVKAYSLPDNPEKTFGFKYGPIVLAAELGRDSQMTLRQVGVQCDVSGNKIVRGLKINLTGNYGGTSNLKPLQTEIIQVNATSVRDFMENINSHFERKDGTLDFILKDTDWDGEFKFSPYYLIHNQRYGIYWIFTASKADKLREQMNAYQPENDEVFIEGIGIGYGAQTEGNDTTYPYFKETGTGSVADPHELTRYAKKGGSFSYEFTLRPIEKNCLVCTFLKADNGKTMKIESEGVEIASFTLDYDGAEEKYTKRFEIPKEISDVVNLRISFSGVNGEESARLCSPTKTVYLKR